MVLAACILEPQIPAMSEDAIKDNQIDTVITTLGSEIFRYSTQPLKASILIGRKARLTSFE